MALFIEMRLEMSPVKYRLFCSGPKLLDAPSNVLCLLSPYALPYNYGCYFTLGVQSHYVQNTVYFAYKCSDWYFRHAHSMGIEM